MNKFLIVSLILFSCTNQEKGDLGDSCVEDSDCKMGWCRQTNHYTSDPERWTTFPDGLCTAACEHLFDCGNTGYCVSSFGEPTPFCIRKCEWDSDCREGWFCAPLGYYGEYRACWPEEV